MTQINTVFSNSDNIPILFGGYFIPDGCADKYLFNMINNIFGYLSINRRKEDGKFPNNLFTFRNVYAPYFSSNIKGCIDECPAGNIVLFSGVPKSLESEVVDINDVEELKTASCPLNQFLTSGNNIVRVFRKKISQETYSMLVFINTITTTFVDKLFSSIPKLMPSLYPNGEIPQDEYTIFKSLAVSDCESVEKIINAKCEELNIAELILRKTFEGYENVALEQRKRNVKTKIDDYEIKYQNYATYLNDVLERMNTEKIVYDSLCNFEPQNTITFVDFLLSHKNNVRCQKEGSEVYYVVDETIEYFDDDMFESYYNNANCHFMQRANADAKVVLNGLFLKRCGKLRVYSEFRLRSLSSLRPLYGGNICGVDYSDHFKHPHLGEYQCLGANELPIDNYLKDGAWDMAIEQSIAATKNINFGDSTVMERFVDNINRKLSDNGKYIIANNGQLMTLKEFVQYVEQLEKEEEKPEEKKEDEQTN